MTTETEPGTAYHNTITDFRRELMGSSIWFEELREPYHATMRAWLDRKRTDPSAVRPPDVIRDADASGMMAAHYAYALAAVLGVAIKELGVDAAQRLAAVADDIITNGDFGNRNADVIPEGERAPVITQGISLTFGADPGPEAGNA